MINHAVILGNLTRDPETRTTLSGKTVTNFAVAVNRHNDGCDYIPCVAWDKLGEMIERHFSKGDMISIAGRIQSRSYEDKSGVKRTSLELVVSDFSFCGSKKKNDYDDIGVDVELPT